MSGTRVPDNPPQPLMDAAPPDMASGLQGLGAAKADIPRQGISKTNEGMLTNEAGPQRDAAPQGARPTKEWADAFNDLLNTSADKWIDAYEKDNGPLSDSDKNLIYQLKALIDRKGRAEDSNVNGGKGLLASDDFRNNPELDKAFSHFVSGMAQSWDTQMQASFQRFMNSTKSKQSVVTTDIG